MIHCLSLLCASLDIGSTYDVWNGDKKTCSGGECGGLRAPTQ